MTYLSLFSGIGGLDLGLDRAGWTCVGQVECDAFASAVLHKHWPEVERWRWIQHLLRDLRNGRRIPVDAVVGGFPCQDISVAGRGKGLAGARSRLWWALLDVIRHIRPRWCVIENVPALRTRGADRVLPALDWAGYACRPLVVGVEHVGGPPPSTPSLCSGQRRPQPHTAAIRAGSRVGSVRCDRPWRDRQRIGQRRQSVGTTTWRGYRPRRGMAWRRRRDATGRHQRRAWWTRVR